MKRLSFQVAISLLFGAGAFAQQDPMLSQYMFNGLYLNPAYAGSHDYWSSTFSYRNQWVRFDGAPETMIAAFDGPIPEKNMGLGLILAHDKIGVSRQSSVLANYSYQLKMNEKDKLAFGINAGFSQYAADLTKLTVWDQDQVFQKDLTGKLIPRAGLGIYYFSKRYYAGFSVPTLLSYQKDYDFSINLTKSGFLRRHYLLTGGYVFDLRYNFKLKPSVLLKYVENTPLQADFNLSIVYKDMFWVGSSIRTGDACVFLLEYQATNRFRIGYAYDLSVSKIRNYSNGSHEIMLGLDFGRNLVKVKTPRYF
jgi:type IX secretion system PorP/SprF family membrane protein